MDNLRDLEQLKAREFGLRSGYRSSGSKVGLWGDAADVGRGDTGTGGREYDVAFIISLVIYIHLDVQNTVQNLLPVVYSTVIKNRSTLKEKTKKGSHPCSTCDEYSAV